MSQSQSQSYYTLEIHYVGRPPQTQSFVAQRVVIGRDAGDIVLGDQQASATHAEIEFDHGQLVVRDLGSSNGTWKDGRAWPQFAISQGQQFTCGHTVIKVVTVVGPKQQRAGATVMGDASMLAGMKAAAQASAPSQPPAPMGGAPAAPMAPVASAAPVAPAAKSGSNTGLLVVICVLLLVIVGGGGFVGYRMLTDEPEPTVAQAEVAAESEPEPEPEPEPSREDLGSAMAEPVEPVEPVEPEPPVESDLGPLYRDVGAATVVIRVPGSVGSGAIIDPKGVVLTNHHVIDGGERDGLKIKAKVILGQFSEELQAFEPQEEALEAYVLKVDEDHDLALLQISDPPKDLPSLSLADKQPYPGQRVAAVGHAGVGMLWAIKGGEISSTGSLSGHVSLNLEESEGVEKELLSRLKRQVEKQGRVIQSTAKILPGDSGGPLVNPERGIVGVNAFGRIDRASGQWVSFHIHLSEVQKFTETIPGHPLDLIPDPWAKEAQEVVVADLDLDGTKDTLITPHGPSAGAVYFDLDQDSALGSDTPKWETLADPATRTFDAELTLVIEGSARHFWYDTDNDGRNDLYMVKSPTSNSVDKAYRVDAKGVATEDRASLIDDGLDAKPFVSGQLRDRLRKVGPVLFPAEIERLAGDTSLPEPLGPATATIKTNDSDSDGAVDTFVEEQMFRTRVFFDLDQDTRAPSGSSFGSQLTGKSSNVEAVAVVQMGSTWVWYDTDNDGRFDLAVEGHNTSSGTIDKAWTLSASGAPSPATGHLGRRLVRPALIPNTTQAKRLPGAARAQMNGSAVAAAAGLSEFPSLKVSPLAMVLMRDRAGFENAVAQVTQEHQEITLLDLDRSSVNKGADHATAAAVVKSGKFDAEFALLTIGSTRWAYYDTDGKDGFDLVLVGTTVAGAKPLEGYRITGAKIETVSSGSTLLQWGVFTDKALGKAFDSLASGLFVGQVREK